MSSFFFWKGSVRQPEKCTEKTTAVSNQDEYTIKQQRYQHTLVIPWPCNYLKASYNGVRNSLDLVVTMRRSTALGTKQDPCKDLEANIIE